MNILVLGGLGFIGHQLTKQLLDQGHNCSVIDRQLPHTHTNVYDARAQIIKQAKIKNYELQSIHSNMIDADTVVHLANYSNDKQVRDHEYAAIRNFGLDTYKLLQSCKHAGVKHFIYVSSSMVYGDFTQDPQPEDAVKNPHGLYGIYKLASEGLVKTFCEQNNMFYTIIRPTAVYGPLDNNNRVINKFINSAINNQDLEVKGTSCLDFTYLDDAATGINLCVNNPNAHNETFNISRSAPVSLEQLAKTVVDIVGSGNIKLHKHDPNYPVRGQLDITKAEKLLGYNPKINIKEGIKKTYDWHNSFYRS